MFFKERYPKLFLAKKQYQRLLAQTIFCLSLEFICYNWTVGNKNFFLMS